MSASRKPRPFRLSLRHRMVMGAIQMGHLRTVVRSAKTRVGVKPVAYYYVGLVDVTRTLHTLHFHEYIRHGRAPDASLYWRLTEEGRAKL
jgi:hypothetical protein